MAEDGLLSPLELVLGRPLGIDPGSPALPDDDPRTLPLTVLEESVRKGLERPPCLVLFSGGRDSSGVLAVSVRVARRLGLAPPVPFTLRFPGVAEAEEGEWQEHVVRHLGLGDWVRRDVDDQLDLLGPYATRVLLRHGVVWPPNTFVLSLAAQAAKGGSVLTGSFGDELFAPDPRLLDTQAAHGGGTALRARRLMRIGLSHSPKAVRRRVARWRHVKDHQLPPWLSRDIRPLARSALAAELAEMDLSWDAGIRSAWRRRYTQVVRRVLEMLAEDESVALVMPFADPKFRVAFARFGGSKGFRSRTEAMHALFEGRLPPDVLQRSSKAVFSGVFWNRRSRAFAQDWSGAGLDPRWVDLDALRQVWSWDPASPGRPDFRSAALLQAAWLAAEGHLTPVSPTRRSSPTGSRTTTEGPPTVSAL
jgi:asparagine synthase (glutamine-hydrolysing)